MGTSSSPSPCVSEREHGSAHRRPRWSGRGGPGAGQLWRQCQRPVPGVALSGPCARGRSFLLHLCVCYTAGTGYWAAHTARLSLGLLVICLQATKKASLVFFHTSAHSKHDVVGHCGPRPHLGREAVHGDSVWERLIDGGEGQKQTSMECRPHLVAFCDHPIRPFQRAMSF